MHSNELSQQAKIDIDINVSKPSIYLYYAKEIVSNGVGLIAGRRFKALGWRLGLIKIKIYYKLRRAIFSVIYTFTNFKMLFLTVMEDSVHIGRAKIFRQGLRAGLSHRNKK